MKRWRVPSATDRFWSTMPYRSYLVVLAAVFCLFSTFGFVGDILSMGRSPARALVLDVIFTGLLAVAWFIAFTKGRRFLALAVPLPVISVVGDGDGDLPAVVQGADGLAAIKERLQLDAVGTTFGVLLGYGCFVFFVVTEGRRYLRIQTEMALAHEIHEALAPPIERRLDRFEFFGASLPSSEVGGDLVDVVASKGRWIAFVADVSGHGVASGTLMAMFKSAARSQLMLRSDAQALLTDLNQVIFELKRPSMFITRGCLAHQGEDTLTFTLAGHLPIVHYRAASATIEQLSVAHLPLGMFEGQTYETVPVQYGRGDLFALLTDGLTEVFDARDQEFGLERFEQTLAAHAHKPLADVFRAVIAEARRHGPQTDDQSLLLVRCG